MKPWQHQEREFNQHRFTRARALLWQMRTGKTKSIIDVACAQFSRVDIDGVIVVAPNGVHRNWTIEQLPQHMAATSIFYVAMAWRFSDKRNTANFETFVGECINEPEVMPWFCVNLESLIRDEVTKAIDHFRKVRPRFLLVVDESHHFAQPGSKRTLKVRSLARHATYRRILSGTSTEDSPLQAYSQYEILEKGALGYTTYEDYKDEFVTYEKQYGRHYETVKEYKNMDILKQRMAKYSSVVLRADCADLPPIQNDVRTVELAPHVRDLYHKFKKEDARTLLNFGFAEPPAGAAMLTKLQQIETGHLITPRGLIDLNDDSAFSIALEEIAEYRTVVFCEYLHDIDYLQNRLSKRLYSVSCISGQHSRRADVIAAFQDGKVEVLLVQSHAGAEGYNLSAADKVLWYSQTHTARIKAQGNERATAVGAKSKQVIDLIVPNGVNAYYKALTTQKTSLADDVSRRGLKDILESLDI